MITVYQCLSVFIGGNLHCSGSKRCSSGPPTTSATSHYTDADGNIEHLQTTDEHPFYVEDAGWVTTGELVAGMVLRNASITTFNSGSPSPPPPATLA